MVELPSANVTRTNRSASRTGAWMQHRLAIHDTDERLRPEISNRLMPLIVVPDSQHIMPSCA